MVLLKKEEVTGEAEAATACPKPLLALGSLVSRSALSIDEPCSRETYKN